MTQTILLTGGAGYIGSHTYVALIKSGYNVVIYDNFSNARADVPARLELITGAPVTVWRGDLLDGHSLNAVFAAHKIDAVIHFAAKKAVGESVRLPIDYFQTNITGLLALLEAMNTAGVHNLVYSSSATVYAETETLPINEDAPLGFASPYAFTKLAGEQIMAQVAASNPAWAFGILRYFNPAGAHESGLIGEDPNGIPNNLLPYIAKVATGDLPALNIFGNDYPTPDGTGMRDYIHVEDLAQGHVLSLAALLAGKGGHLLNLGTGIGFSVMDMLQTYSRACGRDLPYVIAPRRDGDLAAYWADPARAQAILGFTATRGLEDICTSSWNWVKRRGNMGTS